MNAMRIAAAVAAMSVSAALAMGLAPQPAQAATNSISITGVSKTNAPDKSKGTIKTPTVKTSGNVTVSSRAYVITKGKKTVAKTSTQGKTYKLGVGTYKVKSTAKYRTFTSRTTVTSKGWRSESVNSWCQQTMRTSDITFNPDETGYGWATFTGECDDGYGNRYKGTYQLNYADFGWSSEPEVQAANSFPKSAWSSDPSMLSFDSTHKWVETKKTTRTYSGYKALTRTQTVKISRIKPPYSSKAKCAMTVAEYKKIKKGMTVEQVRKIVGCKGRVDSYDKSTYDGEVDITMSLKFSKSNYEWVGNGAKYGWVSFHNGRAYDKSYVDKNHSYSQFWSGI